MALLSRIFSLALGFKEVETNPCRNVAKLKLDNQRYRYLLPEEEPRLRSALAGQRSHLADLVPIAIWNRFAEERAVNASGQAH
jgi:hypothetical protein